MNADSYTPVISVCVPCYNAAPYLAECIDSILSQSFNDFELLIVDDGSTDNSIEIIRSYQDARIRLIENKHDYIYTINTLLNEARGKYVARMDADDIMIEDRLQTQYEYMEANPEIDVLGGGMQFFGDQKLECYPHTEGFITFNEMLEGCCIGHPCTMIVKDVINKYNIRYNPDYIYAEDYHFWMQCLQNGLKLKNLKQLLIKYRCYKTQVTSVHGKQQAENAARIQRETRKWISEQEVNSANEIVNFPTSGNKLSIVIPFLNEGEEVANTIKSAREIAGDRIDVIVINDCSDDNYDYESELKDLSVHYVRNRVRIGAAASKEKGVRLATTPYFLLLDAHMRFYGTEWLDRIINCLKENDRQLLCCQTKVLKKENGVVTECSDMNTFGAYVLFEQQNYIPGIRWSAHRKIKGLEYNQVPCVLGAGYAASKRYWDKIKGLQGLIHYGCEEAYISIKAWLEGGGCRILPDVSIGHIYRDKFPYPVVTAQMIYNYLLIVSTLFPTSLRCMAISVAKQKDKTTYGEAFKWIESRDELNESLKTYYKTFKGHDFSFIRSINDLLVPSAENDAREESKRLDAAMQYCVSEADRMNKYGLLDGLMGYVILFCTYARYSKKEEFEDKATDLFEQICAHINDELPITYGNGICGIGWGILYLQQHGYLEDDMEDVLNSIDLLVMERSPIRSKNHSMHSGLGGVMAYVVARLGELKKAGKQSEVFLPEYMDELKLSAQNILLDEKADYRCKSLAMQIHLFGEDDWEILPPEFEDTLFFPTVLPKEQTYWTPDFKGVVGYAIGLIERLNKIQEQ